ncbi:MAG TPA: sensor domain-containing diguanylate cyclase [Malonomonas sp.]
MKTESLHIAETGRLSDELETLVEIGKALTSHLTLEDVYQVVMEKVGNLLRPQAWSLLTVDEQSAELCFEIVVSPAGETLRGTRLPPGQGVAGWVAEHATALLIPDVSKEPRFASSMEKNIGFVISSIVCVPLVAGNRIVGVIQLLNGLGQSEFTAQDQRILSAIADFTAIAIENSRLHQRVRDLTITDDLTGLYNSRHFQSLCDYEMERATRYGSELSMVFIDLDHFKLVNDTYGHLTGSRLLKEVGQLFQQTIRKIDHAARYGGDEFVFLLPSTGKKGALGMAQNVLRLLQAGEFYSDCGRRIQVTASIGVATYPTNAYCLQELIKLSDEVMYEVKRSTRNAVKSA